MGRHPRLIAWSLVPFLLNCLVFGLLFYFADKFGQELADAILPAATNWFWELVRLLTQGVKYVLIGLMAYFLFVPIGGLIASPFNDMLAEQVGILLTGHTPEGAGWKNFFGDALFAIKVEIKKLLLLAALAGCAFAIGLIPLVQVIAPVLGVLVGVFFVALEYIDYAMAHRKLPFGDRVVTLAWERPGATLGFGLPPYVIAMIPVLNVLLVPLLAPLLVVSGAKLYHEHLAPGGRAKQDAGGP